MAFCTKCGKETEEGILVCDECSAKSNAEIIKTDKNSTPPTVSPETPRVELLPRETAKKSDLILAALLVLPCLLTVNAIFFKGIGAFAALLGV